MRFEAITPENEPAVDAIYPGDQEQYWVHYNWYWKDVSRRKADIAARLIYVAEVESPVGFIAYGQYYQDEALTKPVPGWYEVIHLVIDKPFQRRGYGRQATAIALDLLRSRPDCERIVIAHNPENLAARMLYEQFGFVEFGRNYDGDPLLVLNQ
ncbi:MAG TPA: GNAT family N-acetyltransferase [Herpetosiphonaceae bacterium]